MWKRNHVEESLKLKQLVVVGNLQPRSENSMNQLLQWKQKFLNNESNCILSILAFYHLTKQNSLHDIVETWCTKHILTTDYALCTHVNWYKVSTMIQCCWKCTIEATPNSIPLTRDNNSCYVITRKVSRGHLMKFTSFSRKPYTKLFITYII